MQYISIRYTIYIYTICNIYIYAIYIYIYICNIYIYAIYIYIYIYIYVIYIYIYVIYIYTYVIYRCMVLRKLDDVNIMAGNFKLSFRARIILRLQ